MPRPHDPFRALLWQASDRFFVDPCDLCPDLDANPHDTLMRLSATPEDFGTIKPALTDTRRQRLRQQLVTAARTYIEHHRKSSADAVDQPDLPLPD